jgi:hypothetical protein
MLKQLYNIKSKFIAWVADIRIYAWPMFFIFAGDSHYKIKGPDQRKILTLLKPGDILLRRYNHYLGSLTIKGYWSHAALYVGDDQVIHMLAEGTVKEDILTFMRCDNIMILRLKDTDVPVKAIEKAYKFLKEGIEYDYDFDYSSPKRLYCTEMVDNCIGYVIKKTYPEEKFILPDHFKSCIGTVFEFIWTKEK